MLAVGSNCNVLAADNHRYRDKVGLHLCFWWSTHQLAALAKQHGQYTLLLQRCNTYGLNIKMDEQFAPRRSLGNRSGDSRAVDADGRTISRDHEQSQKSVCFMCWCKGKKCMRHITSCECNTECECKNIAKDIKQFVLSEYGHIQWSWLPTVVCSRCRNLLVKWRGQAVAGEEIRFHPKHLFSSK